MESHLSDRDLLIEIHTDVKALKKDSDDHEDRIRSLEKRSNWLTGAIAVVASTFGVHLGLGK